jgi:predicted O-methyltransferase YrrM
MNKVSKLYYFVLKFFLKKTFSFWERLGFHITPNHFYEPIPDTRDLKDELWINRSELIGIEINEEKQINLLFQFSSKFKNEYESFPRFRTPIPYQYYLNNGSFESVDGEILWCMIRYFKPKRIFEIGSGNSTYLMAQAILKNQEEGNECELTVFDPYPNKIVMAGFPGLSKLVRTKVQEVPLSTFKELKENDILFIDSTHVLKIGSDVQYLYLEVLPRLNKGVLIHIHDIFLPAEYPKEWILKECRFWTEQYILQAFLIFNDHFEVLWGGSYMHLNHPEKLEKAFSSYNRKSTWPGSFWIRKKL